MLKIALQNIKFQLTDSLEDCMSGCGLVERKVQADLHFLEKYNLFQLLHVSSHSIVDLNTLNANHARSKCETRFYC